MQPSTLTFLRRQLWLFEKICLFIRTALGALLSLIHQCIHSTKFMRHCCKFAGLFTNISVGFISNWNLGEILCRKVNLTQVFFFWRTGCAPSIPNFNIVVCFVVPITANVWPTIRWTHNNYKLDTQLKVSFCHIGADLNPEIQVSDIPTGFCLYK